MPRAATPSGKEPRFIEAFIKCLKAMMEKRDEFCRGQRIWALKHSNPARQKHANQGIAGQGQGKGGKHTGIRGGGEPTAQHRGKCGKAKAMRLGTAFPN